MLYAFHSAAMRLAWCVVVIHVATAHADDAAWLRDKGTLVFKDTFDREEDGNLAAAIGNGWNSATANRVPHIKQADLDGGVLKVNSAVEAGHAAHIHHEAGFEDGPSVVRPISKTGRNCRKTCRRCSTASRSAAIARKALVIR